MKASISSNGEQSPKPIRCLQVAAFGERSGVHLKEAHRLTLDRPQWSTVLDVLTGEHAPNRQDRRVRRSDTKRAAEPNNVHRAPKRLTCCLPTAVAKATDRSLHHFGTAKIGDSSARFGRLVTDTLWLRRAHSVGHHRQTLNLLTYALGINALAIHLHQQRRDPPIAA